MNKKLKIILIVIASLIALALLVYLTKTYLFPFITHMHGSVAY